MKQKSRAWIVILAAVILVLALIAVVMIALSNGDLSSLGGGKFMTSTIEVNERFDNNSGARL